MPEDIRVFDQPGEQLASRSDRSHANVVRRVRVSGPADAETITHHLPELVHDGIHLIIELRRFATDGLREQRGAACGHFVSRRLGDYFDQLRRLDFQRAHLNSGGEFRFLCFGRGLRILLVLVRILVAFTLSVRVDFRHRVHHVQLVLRV